MRQPGEDARFADIRPAENDDLRNAHEDDQFRPAAFVFVVGVVFMVSFFVLSK